MNRTVDIGCGQQGTFTVAVPVEEPCEDCEEDEEAAEDEADEEADAEERKDAEDCPGLLPEAPEADADLVDDFDGPDAADAELEAPAETPEADDPTDDGKDCPENRPDADDEEDNDDEREVIEPRESAGAEAPALLLWPEKLSLWEQQTNAR